MDFGKNTLENPQGDEPITKSGDTGEGKSIENIRNEQVRVIQARMIRGTGDNPAREEIIVAANDGAEAKIIAMINERPPEYGDVNAYSEGKQLPKYYAHK